MAAGRFHYQEPETPVGPGVEGPASSPVQTTHAQFVTPREGLVSFFRNSAFAEAMAAGEIDLEREPDQIRDPVL